MPVRMAGGLARKLGRGATGKQKARDPRLYLTAGEHQSPETGEEKTWKVQIQVTPQLKGRQPRSGLCPFGPTVEDEAMATAG